ncbi:MAG: hypothetical protein H6733_12125 [Alphaproteobacteria bacterium]|nr:hypothetical protein [Alphaproteobacteria bacterium]
MRILLAAVVAVVAVVALLSAAMSAPGEPLRLGPADDGVTAVGDADAR